MKQEEQITRGEYIRLKVAVANLSKLHDEVVERKWTNDESLREYACPYPFRTVIINQGGDVYSCCPAYIKTGYSFGSLNSETVADIWNSDNAKKLRYSVIRGDFEYCYRSCFILLNKDKYFLPREKAKQLFYGERAITSWQDCTMQQSPEEIRLSVDATCNLTCPSCRTKIYGNSESENEKILSQLNSIVKPMLKQCKKILANGAGEFFASIPLQAFFGSLDMNAYKDLKVDIVTNGTLLTPTKWAQISNLHGRIGTVQVSIDAANKEIYEKLRRGASWDNLYKNMEYLSDIKRSGDVQEVLIRLVVQNDNFRQMEDFAKLGIKWGFDRVLFTRLTNWGTFTDEEFKSADVFHKDNKNFNEAVRILKDINATYSKQIDIMDDIFSESFLQ